MTLSTAPTKKARIVYVLVDPVSGDVHGVFRAWDDAVEACEAITRNGGPDALVVARELR